MTNMTSPNKKLQSTNYIDKTDKHCKEKESAINEVKSKK